MYFFCVPRIWVPSPSAIHMVHPGKCCRDDLDFIAVLASFQNSKIETTSLQEAVSVFDFVCYGQGLNVVIMFYIQLNQPIFH